MDDTQKPAASDAAPEFLNLTIVSDGTPQGTTITDDDTGQIHDGIAEISWRIKAGEPFAVGEVRLMKSAARVSGKFRVVESIAS